MAAVRVTPVVGLPQFAGWSQVVEHSQPGEPQLIVAFAVAGDQAANTGRDIAESISEQRISNAKELHDFLQGIIDRCQDAGLRLHCSVALLSQQQSFFAAYQGSVLLRRGQKVGAILHVGNQLNIIAGSYRSGDVFALLTQQATEFQNEIELKLNQGYDVETIVTSIVPGVHGREDSSLSALAFVAEGEEPQEIAKSIEEVKEALEANAQVQGVVVEQQKEKPDVKITLPKVALPAIPRAQIGQLVGRISSGAREILKKTQAKLTNRKPAINLPSSNGDPVSDSFSAGEPFASVAGQKKGLSLPSISFQRAIYLKRGGRQRNWRFILTALVSLAAVVAIGVWLIGRQQKIAQAQAILEPIQASVTTAREQVEADPITARSLVNEAITRLETEYGLYESDAIIGSRIKDELDAARTLYDEISGREEFAELAVFYDLRLAQADFVATHADVVGNQAVFVDSQQQQLIFLNLENKQVQTRSLEELEPVRDIRMREDNVLLLSGGIQQVSLAEDGEEPTIDNLRGEGDSNRAGTLLGAFDRFLYVINPEKRNIYRYASTEDGFSDPIGWVQSPLGITFEEIVSMAIDGDIWLATRGGELKRFTSGRPSEFEITGLSESFSSAITVYTTSESESLYVLEPGSNRVVIFNKNGEFLREIKSTSLSSATDIIVSEELGKIFAVSGSIIFEIGL